ncbi:FtsK/SpoIIIE domain-containing protein [Pseudarthrobacter phenanthrenivorans]|uniref:FtsK/SpoIIIE domain-containing protein n=1 Tax=Pseudarthrobacter phenanthrenivorans TaxID=361575 RepID=UPI00344F8205
MISLFSKPRSVGSPSDFNIAQAAAAAAALEFHRHGDTKSAEKMLRKHGLTLEVAVAYMAPLAPVAEEASESESARPEPVNLDTATEMDVDLPAKYTDTVEQRAKLIAWLWAQNGEGWQIESFDQKNLKAKAVRGRQPLMRPGAAVYKLEDNATASNGEASAIAHGAVGRTMLSYDFDPVNRTAQTAVLPPATVEIRQWILQKNPRQKSYELELLPLFSVQDGEGVLDRVIITRADQPMDRMKALAYWMEVARTVVGHPGWTVEMDDRTGRVELISGKVRRLPRIVPGKNILPQEIDMKDWSSFAVGLNSIGVEVRIDLQAGPHTLVVGGTGSGKSVALRAIILNALAKGFEVVIIDPTKQAAGLLGIRPWTKGIFIKDAEEAASALAAVYAEVRRRVEMITAVGGENWMDLPQGTVKPILILVDEFSALVTADKKPVGLKPDDEMMLEWAAEAGARARVQSFVGKIAKEARSAGVHLVISTQRPDAADIGGNVRENIGTVIQLVVPSRPPSPEALRMVFPAECQPEAVEEIQLLNDGRSKGFALAYLEGGGVQGFRVGLVEKDDMAGYAQEMGIPLGDPLQIAATEPRPFSAVAPAWEPKSEPAVRDLGEMSLELDELEWPTEDEDESAAETVVDPAWAASGAEDETVDPAWAATGAQATEDEEPLATPASPLEEDEDPFATPVATARVSPPRVADPDEEDDPFAEPIPRKVSAVVEAAAFNWDSDS